MFQHTDANQIAAFTKGCPYRYRSLLTLQDFAFGPELPSDSLPPNARAKRDSEGATPPLVNA